MLRHADFLHALQQIIIIMNNNNHQYNNNKFIKFYIMSVISFCIKFYVSYTIESIPKIMQQFFYLCLVHLLNT